MCKLGRLDVTVNSGKRGRYSTNGDPPNKDIKKPRKGEINFLPQYPEGLDDHNLEAARQVCCEFTRVVGKNLKENFFEALDRFSPNLMDLFRKKKGLSGQVLTDLLRQTKTTEPTDIRCLCLRGLPVVLGDDPSAFFKTCSDATDKDLYSETSVGILCIDEHPQLNPSRVSIVLEGSVVMEELANLPQAFCVLFGLIYALHLDYPKCMKSTFHFIQQVTCGQEDGGHDGCVPGFQLKHYQVVHSGPFRKGQSLLQVEFDDCEGNEDVTFRVSDPSFTVDEDLNVLPVTDVLHTGPVMFVHGVSAHADDTAQVDISGHPVTLPRTLRDILGVGEKQPYRTKRSLLVPPMIVTENQRAPFPRNIGKQPLKLPTIQHHFLLCPCKFDAEPSVSSTLVISMERSGSHIFQLTGPGADRDPRGLFTIDIHTGDVSVSRSLDREAIDSYQPDECWGVQRDASC
uniref:Cadherin domain-containing protein n=1 Tax=Knipowitschia caucasica TaxID=637954 RepID=A0AAV2KZ61_KNICA